MLKRILIALGITLLVRSLTRGNTRPSRRLPAPAAKPRQLPAPRARRNVHREMTGAAVADRWESEGSADLIASARL